MKRRQAAETGCQWSVSDALEPPQGSDAETGDGLWLTSDGPLSEAPTAVGKALAQSLGPEEAGWFLFFNNLNAFGYLAGRRARVRWLSPPSAVVLNWSERAQWPFWNLAVWDFNIYAGSGEYNPIAIVIRPPRTPRRFRFWRAFRDFKHGKPAKLQQVEREFFDCIGVV
jgi:hypothetical protein